MNGGHLRMTLILAVLVTILVSCTSQQPSQSRTKIQVEKGSGFTITENVRVSAEVRADYTHAIGLLENGDREAGIALLEQVVERAPAASAARIDLAIALRKSDRLEDAAGHLQQVLDSNPGHPVAHNEMGILRRKAGDFVAARQSYEAALEIYPAYHFARRNLAVLCEVYLQDLECAMKHYEFYLGIVPADEEVTMWVEDLRRRIGKGNGS